MTKDIVLYFYNSLDEGFEKSSVGILIHGLLAPSIDLRNEIIFKIQFSSLREKTNDSRLMDSKNPGLFKKKLFNYFASTLRVFSPIFDTEPQETESSGIGM